jgi:hypothetical protein
MFKNTKKLFTLIDDQNKVIEKLTNNIKNLESKTNNLADSISRLNFMNEYPPKFKKGDIVTIIDSDTNKKYKVINSYLETETSWFNCLKRIYKVYDETNIDVYCIWEENLKLFEDKK